MADPNGSGQNNNGGGGDGNANGGGGAPSFVQTIPESFRDRDWAKQNTKTPDDFFKWVDNLNTSFGKKGPAQPGENATPEEIKAFNKWAGVPDKEDDYQFSPIEELKDAQRNPDIEKAVKKIMLDAGIPKAAATKLQQGYEKLLYAQHKQTLEQNKKLDMEFDKTTKDLFGDKKDTVIANAKKFLTEHLPESVKGKLDKLDNDSLVVLTAALDGIVSKYVKEDGFRGGEGAPGGVDTMDTLSAEQRKLFASPEFRDPRHADHQKAHDRNKAIMDKMRALIKR
jgi:hypothetical protein